MTILHDYDGRSVRLTDERLEHIRKDHPELVGREDLIGTTIRHPRKVVQSISDPSVRLCYSRPNALFAKMVCVVVKDEIDDGFVLSAYLTDRIKRGEILWQSQ